MEHINEEDLGFLVEMLNSKFKSSPSYKKILNLHIRHITEHKQKHLISPKLKCILIEYSLYTSDYISINQMRDLNKKLKNKGYKSEKSPIQLEHWKDVLAMRNELLKLTHPTIGNVNEYFLRETNCFFKLTEKEWSLQPQNNTQKNF